MCKTKKMPNKENNIILYNDSESKVNVNVRFADEKSNTTVKNLFTVQLTNNYCRFKMRKGTYK